MNLLFEGKNNTFVCVFSVCVQYPEFISTFIMKVIKNEFRNVECEVIIGLLVFKNVFFFFMFVFHIFTFKCIVLLHSTWKNKPVLLPVIASLSSCPSAGSSSLDVQSVTSFVCTQTSARARWWGFLNFAVVLLNCYSFT